ncbi:MAG: 2-amino-4-hydroxy-6-hydroxymethyldihydropteridine diphosphokinase [Methyloligellaceae bacterium]
MGRAIIALGSNLGPLSSGSSSFLKFSISSLEGYNIRIQQVAPVYESIALGASRQGVYLNSVLIMDTALSPLSLLRKLKQVERKSGRRGYGRPWSARTLDLDIISYNKQVLNWDVKTQTPLAVRCGDLNIPHSQAHKRPFVLSPLVDILPEWRHPVLGKTAMELNKTAEKAVRSAGGGIIRIV